MRAYAKVNLALNNLGKKGTMHELDMIMSEIDIYDEINIEISNTEEIKIFGMDLSKEKNLMFKAAKLFMNYYNLSSGLNIYIKKHIPMEAGLGGGSSDAACVMKILNEMFKVNASLDELKTLAFKLGSDVPFFIQGGLCRVQGFGDKVKQIKKCRIKNIILIKPKYGLSTKEVFDLSDKYSVINKSNVLDEIEKGLIKEEIIYKELFNDLETPANEISSKYALGINDYKRILMESGADVSLMSGSGSTVFGIFKNGINSSYDKLISALNDEIVYKI